MKIALLTDIHHWEDANYSRYKGENYINLFGRAFEETIRNPLALLCRDIQSCDLVINLGDLIHNTKTPEWDFARYMEAVRLFPCTVPVRHVIGNHDSWDISRKDWAHGIGAERSYYAFELGWYRHIVLDSSRIGKTGPGIVPLEQLTWLRQELQTTALPVIVYSHYPIDERSMEGNYWFQERPEKAFVVNSKEVRKILEEFPKVRAFFSGHTHFAHDHTIHGIRHITVPSFAENDGNHAPACTYMVATIDDDLFHVELRKTN